MHKWLQLPATPTDDPLATVYPVNHHYKKSHVYAVTRINPIYVDDEQHGTWDKSGSSGYYSRPHSDRSSVDKRSPPAVKCLRAGTPPPPSDGSSGGSSAAAQRNAVAPWLSPIKEGVIDVHQFCIPRPVWPGRDDDAHRRKTAVGATPRPNCCRHCARCRCRNHSGGGSTTNTSTSTSTSSGDSGAGGSLGKLVTVGSYSGYTSSAYGGTVSTTGTGSCSDEAVPSSGTASVKSNRSPLAASPDTRFARMCSPMDNWYSVDPTLNQKTDNLQHYDCGAMLRGLQFTLDSQQAEKLMEKIKVGKKQRCWCRLVTACLGLIMFLVSVVTVSLALTRGQKMFGSL